MRWVLKMNYIRIPTIILSLSLWSEVMVCADEYLPPKPESNQSESFNTFAPDPSVRVVRLSFAEDAPYEIRKGGWQGELRPNVFVKIEFDKGELPDDVKIGRAHV